MSNRSGKAEFNYRVIYDSDARGEPMLAQSTTNSAAALAMGRQLVSIGRKAVRIEIRALEASHDPE